MEPKTPDNETPSTTAQAPVATPPVAAPPAIVPPPAVQRPSLGRIVILNGTPDRAAIITRVFSDTCVNLVAYSECGKYTTAIQSCTQGKFAGDWSWPART